MVNYSNGKIYKIVSSQTNKVYIGSTTTPLCERLSGHRQRFRRWKLGKDCYLTSYDILKYDDARIVLICNFPCSNVEELHKKEQEIMDEYEDKVNRNKAFPGFDTKEEYYQNYRVENCEKLREKNRLYREANPEKLQKKSQVYYEKTKETSAVKERKGELGQCECGFTGAKRHLLRHQATQKHIKAMEKKNNL